MVATSILGRDAMPRRPLRKKFDRELQLEIEGAIRGVSLLVPDLMSLSIKDSESLKVLQMVAKELMRYSGKIRFYSKALEERRRIIG